MNAPAPANAGAACRAVSPHVPYTAACAAMRAALGWKPRHGGKDRGSIATRFNMPPTGRLILRGREVPSVPLLNVILFCAQKQVSADAARRWRVILRSAKTDGPAVQVPPDDGTYHPRPARKIREGAVRARPVSPQATPRPPAQPPAPAQAILPGFYPPPPAEAPRHSRQEFGVLCDLKAEVHRLATTVFELRQLTDAASANAGAWSKRILEALEALEQTVAIQATGSRVSFAKAIEDLAKDLRQPAAAGVSVIPGAGAEPQPTDLILPKPQKITVEY